MGPSCWMLQLCSTTVGEQRGYGGLRGGLGNLSPHPLASTQPLPPGSPLLVWSTQATRT